MNIKQLNYNLSEEIYRLAKINNIETYSYRDLEVKTINYIKQSNPNFNIYGFKYNIDDIIKHDLDLHVEKYCRENNIIKASGNMNEKGGSSYIIKDDLLKILKQINFDDILKY